MGGKERVREGILYMLSHSVAPWAPFSMEFSGQEYWSELPFPSPRDLPNPGTEPRSPALQGDSLPAEPPGKRSYLNKAGLG